MDQWSNSTTNDDVIRSQSNYINPTAMSSAPYQGCSANPQIGAAMATSKNKGSTVDDAIRQL